MLLSLSEEKFQFILGVVNVSFNLCWSPVFHPSILPAFTKKKLKKQLLYSKIPTIKLIWVYVHTNPLRQPRHKVCYESDCILNGLNPEHSHIPHPGISSFLSHLFNCYIPQHHSTAQLHYISCIVNSWFCDFHSTEGLNKTEWECSPALKKVKHV